MGAGGSRETEALKRKKNVRYYRPPNVRQKDRFEPEEVISTITTFEATIDRFDYLIVFPLTEGPYVSPTDEDAEGERIDWTQCKEIWRQGIPGTDATKQKSLESLSKFWEKRTGSLPKDGDTVLVTAWRTMVREAMVHQLTNRSGLQLKLSAYKKYIYCRLRAPMKLLELQADLRNYRLQFKGEIDPGSEEFWNLEMRRPNEDDPVPIELEEEKIEYTKDEATIILEKLYRAQKVSPHDLAVNPKQETPAVWSRRVHALERIADKIPVWNKYPAYTQFSTDTCKRYLYQLHDNVRGKTLFRAKDRLFLTKAVIDKYFDYGVFQEYGVVDCIMALHDANRGDKVTIDVLQRRWVTFWRVTAREVGSPLVTMWGYEESEEVWTFLRPFSQPLLDIRDYFGEKVSLYFAWLGFYTMALLVPSILGAGMIVVFTIRGYQDTVDHIDGFLVGFLLLMVTWGAVYCRGWDRECKAISVKWGTTGFEEEESDRPQFRGDPNKPLARSPITNQIETNYPAELRLWYEVFAWFAILICIGLALGFVGAVFYAQYLIMYTYTDYDFDGQIWVTSAVLAIVVQINFRIFLPISRYLNDLENHRTETDHEDALITKVLVFEIFNNFSASIFTAFAKSYVLDSCDADSGCIYDLRVLLYIIIMLRTATNVWGMAWPVTSVWIYERIYGGVKDGKGEDEEKGLEPDDDVQYISEHLERLPYEGVLENYLVSVIQLGYILMFSGAIPILALVALGENLIKMRADAWKLCAYTRRPHIILAEDVGRWAFLMDLMTSLGIVVSTGVLIFTSYSFDEYSFWNKLIIFLVAEQVVFLYKTVLYALIPDEPDWVEDIIKRNNFVVEKYFKGYDDNDEDLDISTLKGDLVDTIDVDGVNLYDLRKARAFTEAEFAEMERLEGIRRELLSELRMAKDQLQTIYKTEHLNEFTGIGETKFGLPLGRLSAMLIQVQNLKGENLEMLGSRPSIKVRLSIKGPKVLGQPAGPPPSSLSESSTVQVKDGTAQLNQSIGPIAPIRTLDAEAVFEIIDMAPTVSEASIAIASIRLRDLQDQQPVDKVLHLKLRLASGELMQSDARLFVRLTFNYSKVVPMRNKIYQIQDKLRIIEKDLATIKAGKKNLGEEEDD